MKKSVGVVLSLLLVGCAGGASNPSQPSDTTGNTASASASSPAFPEDRTTPTPECNAALRQASLKIIAPDASMGECASVVDWLSSLKFYPGALGLQQADDVTVAQLAELCSGLDSAPVCADAIERGLITSTGDTRKLNQLSAAARLCKVDSALEDDGKKLVLILGTEKTTGRIHAPEEVDCVLDALKAPAEVKARAKETTAANGKSDSWGDVKADWTFDETAGLRLTLTWTA